jgi:oligopeptide transport system substrate-binding protein
MMGRYVYKQGIPEVNRHNYKAERFSKTEGMMKFLSAQITWKGLRLLFILALAVSALGPGEWRLARAQAGPTLRVDSYNFSAEGYEWPLGAQVTLSVEDPETDASPDYTAAATLDPNQTYISFNLNGVDLHPGVTVALSDGTTTKEVLLGSLDAVRPYPGQSLVNGVADPNSLITVGYWEGMTYAYRRLQASGDGNWQVDFSVLSDPGDQGIVSQLLPGSGCQACQVDAEGDGQCYSFQVLDPRIIARPWSNTVVAQDWAPGAILTLRVDDPQTPATPDYTAVQTAKPYKWDTRYTRIHFYLAQALNLRAGMEITLGDGVITKTHTIVDMSITAVDIVADKVSGLAPPGSILGLSAYDNYNDAYREVEAGEEGGTWEVDFSQAAPGENTADLGPGTQISVQQWDVDGDNTQLNLPANTNMYAPRRITIKIGLNMCSVQGADWPPGNSVTLTVDDPGTLKNPDNTATKVSRPYDPANSLVEFNLNCTILHPGTLVTLSDEIDTRSLVFHNLGIRGVNTFTDIVSGFSAPYSGVWVKAYLDDGEWTRYVYADEDGYWTADFSRPGLYPDMQELDLTGEMDIRAYQYDEDGDITQLRWRSPSLKVWLSDETISGNRWPNGATITLTIEDPATPQSPDLQIPQTVHALWPEQVLFNLSGLSDLQPGQKITLSDGVVTRSQTIDNLTVTQVDTLADQVTGIAPPEAEVCLYRWDDENYELCVPADTNGNWTADLGYDLQPGAAGNACIQDATGGVWVTWYAGWSAPDPETLVFAAGSPFDLDVTGNEVGENYFTRLQLFEPLLRPGLEVGLEPAASSDYSLSPDGRVYTFTLRQAASWSDGIPLTAQHFVDGILRQLDPALATGYASLLFPIQGAQDYYEGGISDPDLVGVRALAADTLQITLGQPTAHFIQVLTTPIVLPVRRDLIDQYGNAWQDAGNFQGNGPYRLVERDGAHLLLAPNPYYHSPQQVTFDSVAFSYIPVIEDQLNAFRSGQVDVVLGASAQYPLIKADPALLPYLHRYDGSVTFLGLRVEKAPLNNLLVRQALAHATDRQALLDGLRPASQVALGVIPPGIEGYQGGAIGLPYNPTLAQDLLAQAGYPGGAGFPEIELIASTQMVPQAEQVAAGWQAVLNIPVRIATYRNRLQYLNNCRAGPASCATHAYLFSWLTDYPDGYGYLNDLFHPDATYSWTGWDNPNYRMLMDQIAAESDPAQRLAYMHQAERLPVQDEAAAIPLYFPQQTVLARNGVYPYLERSPASYLTRWGDSDLDGEGLPDLIDPCPADPLDACNPAGSAAGVYGPDGGEPATEDGSAALDIPAGALDERITFTIVDAGSDYVLDTNLGDAQAALSYDIGPECTTFAIPATITLHWADTNDDGVVDGTDLLESGLYVFKDGAAVSSICSLDAGCDMVGNTFSVQVSSLSRFVLGTLLAPVIEAIHAPFQPLPVGATVQVSAEVRNLDNNSTLTWEWDDGTSTTSTALSATHVYNQAGIYILHLTVNKPGFAPVSAAYEYIVIYDPAGGFVTGGGWIADPTGKAHFGLNAKYKKNSTLPEGNTEFQFKEADLRLRSTAYDWLVVSSTGAWAIYKGIGLVNEQLARNGTPYKFMVWAIDGQPDALRIKIWWLDNDGQEQVIFDNGSQQPPGGGSIVIHQK